MLIRMHKGKPMVEQTDGIVRGVVPAITTENVEPRLEWCGSHLPQKMYMQTVAFAKYCMDTYGGEVQGRLYYSEKYNQWRVVVLPQWISKNLHTQEIKDHALRSKAMKSVSSGDWVQNGTWHSHGYAMAGQSTVDLADEIKQSGFHYTVGSLKMDTASFHCRYSFRGLMYQLGEKAIVKNPKVKVSKCTSFPNEWKQMLIEDTRPRAVNEWQTGNGISYTSFGRLFHGKWYSAKEWDVFVQSGAYMGALGFGDVNPKKEDKRAPLGWPEREETYTPYRGIDNESVVDLLVKHCSEPEHIVEAFCHLAMQLYGTDSISEAIMNINELIEDEDRAQDEMHCELFDHFNALD